VVRHLEGERDRPERVDGPDPGYAGQAGPDPVPERVLRPDRDLAPLLRVRPVADRATAQQRVRRELAQPNGNPEDCTRVVRPNGERRKALGLSRRGSARWLAVPVHPDLLVFDREPRR
jgi:hypothetical protein